MTVETMFWYCPNCARECLIEAPPCRDGHGDSCPDRACTECGTALLLDAALVALVRPYPRSRRAA